MAKFPVELNDDEGQADAINYLLSGPSGLGQNFAGFSSYEPSYLTGNYRVPYSRTTLAPMYVAPISCSSAVQLDDRTFQYNFASSQPTPPFQTGNNIAGSGWTNGFYNGGQGAIGVVECTTTYVIFRTNDFYPGIGDDYTGGYVYWDAIRNSNGDPIDISTDCNARVTVTGGTDRVFISGQLDQLVNYTVTSGTQDMTIYCAVNRYYAYPNDNPINPDYLFDFQGTVAEKQYTFTGLTGTGTLPLIETVYSTLLDRPGPGYYWYILEVRYDCVDTVVDNVILQLRSLSAQVVKQ